MSAPNIDGSVASPTLTIRFETDSPIFSMCLAILYKKYAYIRRNTKSRPVRIHAPVDVDCLRSFIVKCRYLYVTFASPTGGRKMTDRPLDRVLCVFVPGLKGSVLRCETCERRTWPPPFLDKSVETVRRAVTKGSRKIEHLMNADETTCLVTHPQTVCGIVRKVRILNGLYTRDVYDTFLDHLQDECDGAGLTRDGLHRMVTLHTFAYDWTLGVRHAAERLFSYLQNSTGVYSVVVLIAHSMGGLVCRYMLERMCCKDGVGDDPGARRLSHKVKLLYGLGVPHYGTVRALHYLIDPNGGDFTERCRGIQSLFDLIPFSDLNAQIDGIDEGIGRRPCPRGTSLRRYRSELFLKRTDREVVVDRDDWKPQSGSSGPYRHSRVPGPSGHIYCLLERLKSRFPALARYEDRLREAVDVHFSLDSARRPSGCTYLFVNALGVLSPSLINKNGVMIRECARGDGLVCSVIDERHTAECMEAGTCGGTTRNGTGSAAESERSGERRYSVHVKMLKHIDVFRVVQDVMAREFFGSSAVGIKRMWRQSLEGDAESEVASSSRVTFRQWTITATNLKSGRFVLSVRAIDNLEMPSAGVGMEIGIAPTALGDCVPDSANNQRLTNGVTRVVVKPADDWCTMTVIVSGYHRIVGIRDL